MKIEAPEAWAVQVKVPIINIADRSSWILSREVQDWLHENVGRRCLDWDYFGGWSSNNDAIATMGFRDSRTAVMFKLRWG